MELKVGLRSFKECGRSFSFYAATIGSLKLPQLSAPYKV
jgi:hypothetical protein